MHKCSSDDEDPYIGNCCDDVHSDAVSDGICFANAALYSIFKCYGCRKRKDGERKRGKEEEKQSMNSAQHIIQSNNFVVVICVGCEHLISISNR